MAVDALCLPKNKKPNTDNEQKGNHLNQDINERAVVLMFNRNTDIGCLKLFDQTGIVDDIGVKIGSIGALACGRRIDVVDDDLGNLLVIDGGD